MKVLLPVGTVVALLAIGLAVYMLFFRVPDHEIWVLDQGTDSISIYNSDHELVSAINVSPEALRQVNPDFNPESGVTVPHMIDFDSDWNYAFVAGTAGGVTIVIDANRREVVAALQTGGGSRMAAVTPDDDAVWVAAIGARQLVQIPLDLKAENPVFQIGATISVETLLTEQTDYEWPSFSPVCHQYNDDGTEAWITLGPGIAQGGLFVFDTETHNIVHAYDPAEVRANFGVAFSDNDRQVLANWSGVFGAAAEGNDQEGTWYTFDARSKELLGTESSQGIDAHGLRLNPRKGVYWQVNRGSNDGIIIDEDSLEVVGTFPAGDSPDILDFSPDGKLAYITQRGPVPRSGDPHVATGSNPGVIVVDTETFAVVAELIPDRAALPDGHARAGELANDVHGVGVRLTSSNEATVLAAPLFAANFNAINFCVIDFEHQARDIQGRVGPEEIVLSITGQAVRRAARSKR
ncbi:MAG: hypothetical protein O2919_03110 [Chloroflexi bacterium]|nr:hypothetical protein [Chloroflexota bacterium]